MSVDRAISALTRGGEPRTWSLIVTVFGDMARDEGATIPGPVLSLITGRIGIRPEAMRVALHRLRKDSWISSQKQGRVSHYRLSANGRAETAKATGRIYAPRPPAPDRWHVLIAGPMDPAARLALEGGLLADGYVALGQGAWLGAGAAPEQGEMFVLEGTDPAVPDWLRAQLLPVELAVAYGDFLAALDEAEAALGPGEFSALCELDRAALRVLIVHGWRRLVLRHPDLPDDFFPAGWAGPVVRAKVQALLARLGRASVAEIIESAEA